MRSTSTIINTFINSFFPTRCILCEMLLDETSFSIGHSNMLAIMCTHCQCSIPTIESSCSKCSTPLIIESELCGVCLKQERYWHLCSSAFAYSSHISNLILLFKHQNNKKLINYFAQNIFETINESDTENCDFLCPVPMHPKRFALRGFNQSYELTKVLSRITSTPYLNLFSKTQETPQQASLDKKDREVSLKNSFLIKKQFLSTIRGSHIVLIDDVVTTGATTSELARILKIAKAKRVDVWCIART